MDNLEITLPSGSCLHLSRATVVEAREGPLCARFRVPRRMTVRETGACRQSPRKDEWVPLMTAIRCRRCTVVALVSAGFVAMPGVARLEEGGSPTHDDLPDMHILLLGSFAAAFSEACTAMSSVLSPNQTLPRPAALLILSTTDFFPMLAQPPRTHAERDVELQVGSWMAAAGGRAGGSSACQHGSSCVRSPSSEEGRRVHLPSVLDILRHSLSDRHTVSSSATPKIVSPPLEPQLTASAPTHIEARAQLSPWLQQPPAEAAWIRGIYPFLPRSSPTEPEDHQPGRGLYDDDPVATPKASPRDRPHSDMCDILDPDLLLFDQARREISAGGQPSRRQVSPDSARGGDTDEHHHRLTVSGDIHEIQCPYGSDTKGAGQEQATGAAVCEEGLTRAAKRPRVVVVKDASPSMSPRPSPPTHRHASRVPPPFSPLPPRPPAEPQCVRPTPAVSVMSLPPAMGMTALPPRPFQPPSGLMPQMSGGLLHQQVMHAQVQGNMVPAAVAPRPLMFVPQQATPSSQPMMQHPPPPPALRQMLPPPQAVQQMMPHPQLLHQTLPRPSLQHTPNHPPTALLAPPQMASYTRPQMYTHRQELVFEPQGLNVSQPQHHTISQLQQHNNIMAHPSLLYPAPSIPAASVAGGAMMTYPATQRATYRTF